MENDPIAVLVDKTIKSQYWDGWGRIRIVFDDGTKLSIDADDGAGLHVWMSDGE